MWCCGGLRRPEMGDRRRERFAGERRERLWGILRCESQHGTPMQLKPVIRWISDEKIVRL